MVPDCDNISDDSCQNSLLECLCIGCLSLNRNDTLIGNFPRIKEKQFTLYKG